MFDPAFFDPNFFDTGQSEPEPPPPPVDGNGIKRPLVPIGKRLRVRITIIGKRRR